MSEDALNALEAARARMLRDRLAKLPPEYQPAESKETMCLAEDPDGFQCTCTRGHGGEDNEPAGASSCYLEKELVPWDQKA